MLRKASAKGELPAAAKLTSQKERGAQNLAISTVDGWLIGEEQDFVIFETDSNNDIVPGSATSWKGVPASNGSIAGLTLTGGLDRLYPIGAVVAPTATSAWANDLVEWLLKSHNPDGTLKESAIPELKPQVIPDKSITADKIDFTTMPGNKYMTTEIDTGKKWINGKSIYQKSITFNTTGSGTEETGANNENFSYIDTLISLDAILNMPNGERYPNSYTNPSAPSLQYFQLKFANWDGAQKLRYQTRTVGTVAMTILYTKK
jgi:hypothetical protein|nr:MAG TPA: hypothetical protein [Caudoviricetes sp.]